MGSKTKTPRLKPLIGLRSEPQGMKFDDYDAAMEQPVLVAIASAGPDGVRIVDLAEVFYGTGCAGKRAGNKAQAKSWARNALRRPQREGYLVRKAPGVYALSAKGAREVPGARALLSRSTTLAPIANPTPSTGPLSEPTKLAATSARKGPKSATTPPPRFMMVKRSA